MGSLCDPIPVLVGSMRTEHETAEREVAIGSLGEKLAGLRLADKDIVRTLAQSLRQHGQLTALCVYETDQGALEIADGFKRLHAARSIEWTTLRVRVIGHDVVAAIASIEALNGGRGLTEIEQAWLCRRLCREHGLAQYQVGRLLGRDKSWVCRRLVLAEGLDETVQADVRLGLLVARSASEVARLSRDNQRAAADVVLRRGLTVGQTAKLVTAVLGCPDAAARARWLKDARVQIELEPRTRPARKDRSPAEQLLDDIDSATRVGARLQVRLREQPLDSFDPRLADLLREALRALVAVIDRLHATLDRTLAGEDLRNAAME